MPAVGHWGVHLKGRGMVVSIDEPVPGETIPEGPLLITETAADSAGPIRYAVLDVKTGPSGPFVDPDPARITPGQRIDGTGPFEWTYNMTGLTSGLYSFRTTTYGQNESVVKFVTVTLSGGTAAPVAALTATQTAGILSITANASASTGDAPLTYTWEVDNIVVLDPGDAIEQLFTTAGAHTVRVTVTDPSGRTSQASKTVTVAAPSAPGPVKAAFSVIEDDGVYMKLDGSASTGTGLTYDWDVPGTGPLPATDQIIRLQRPVGTRLVRLTVTSSTGATHFTERNVTWNWTPKRWVGQVDAANGVPQSGTGRAKIYVEPLTAPFRVSNVLNMTPEEGGPALSPQPDGTAIYKVRQGWHPGTTGGDRTGMDWNQAYDMENGAGNTNVMGGKPLEERWINYGVLFPVENWLKPDGTPVDMANVHNNWTEFHGTAGGGSTLKISPGDQANTTINVEFQPNPGPVPVGYHPLPANRINPTPIAPGTWHRLLINLIPSTLENGGFVRVYRFRPNDPAADADGWVCVSAGIKSYRRTDDGLWYVQDVPLILDPADPDYGKIFGPIVKFVKQADGTFAPEPLNVGYQLYRQRLFDPTGPKAGLPMPDSTMRLALPRIGPTRESVI